MRKAQVSGPNHDENARAPATTLSTPSRKPLRLGVSGFSSRPVNTNASSDGGGRIELPPCSAAKLPLSMSSAAANGAALSSKAAASAQERIVDFPITGFISASGAGRSMSTVLSGKRL
jgi:hypothetical protein